MGCFDKIKLRVKQDMEHIYQESLKHLEENNMSYREHALFSLYNGYIMFVGSLQCVVHSIIPHLYPKSSSRPSQEISKRLAHQYMTMNKS